MKWLKVILAWLTPSQETKEATIWTAMRVEGYTDTEIELEIQEIRNHVQKPL